MTSNYLFELGLEEMPAKVIEGAQEDLVKKVTDYLKEEEISYDEIQAFSTPRRLSFIIKNISTNQVDKEEEIKGPSKKVALSEDGEWTKAAKGFTKGQGLEVDDIYFKTHKGEEYTYVKKIIEGKQIKEIIQGFSSIVEHLYFPVSMRWANHNFHYIRPVHWLVSVLGEEVFDMEVFGIKAGKNSRGHRDLGSDQIEVSAENYQEQLKDNYVIVDRTRRQSLIKEQMLQLEDQNNWKIPTDNQDLLDEVTDLVEYPTVFYGNFDSKYLDVPSIILETAMADHQRYFPVYDAISNKMLNHFVAVRNGNEQFINTVISGNEKVLVARLEDAEFFYKNDQNTTIDTFVDQLKNVTFQEKLGTLFDKQNRVKVIAAILSKELAVSDQIFNHVIRASEIYKFDLETGTVKEFSDLQGKVGRILAEEKGESNEVALAIEESYMPTSSTGQLPQSKQGVILSLAEKLDTLLSFFSLGEIPSGSNDPNALRRNAIGLVRILKTFDSSLSLPALIETIIGEMPVSNDMKNGFKAHESEFYSFIDQRIDQLLKDEGYKHDIRQAVLNSQLESIRSQFKVAKILKEAKKEKHFKDLVENLTRVSNLAKKNESQQDLDRSLAQSESEQALIDQSHHLGVALEKGTSAQEYYHLLKTTTPKIAAFFENNMVMTDEENIKNNRLALLSILNAQIIAWADFTQLVL